jgi:hypothetical protein
MDCEGGGGLQASPDGKGGGPLDWTWTMNGVERHVQYKSEWRMSVATTSETRLSCHVVWATIHAASGRRGRAGE